MPDKHDITVYNKFATMTQTRRCFSIWFYSSSAYTFSTTEQIETLMGFSHVLAARPVSWLTPSDSSES